jgi:hypothetical protein
VFGRSSSTSGLNFIVIRLRFGTAMSAPRDPLRQAQLHDSLRRSAPVRPDSPTGIRRILSFTNLAALHKHEH